MKVRRYHDLLAWQKAMDLVERIYSVTTTFPKEEQYGLTSLIRRAAVSVPPDIAEGQCRNGRCEFVHHLSGRLLAKAEETGRILVSLMHSLERYAAAS